VLGHLLDNPDQIVNLDASRRECLTVEPVAVEHPVSQSTRDGFGVIVRNDFAAANPLSSIEYLGRRSREDIVHQSDLVDGQSQPSAFVGHARIIGESAIVWASVLSPWRAPRALVDSVERKRFRKSVQGGAAEAAAEP